MEQIYNFGLSVNILANLYPAPGLVHSAVSDTPALSGLEHNQQNRGLGLQTKPKINQSVK